LTYAEQIELEGLFDRITLAEEKVEALEKQLADPALYSTRREEIPQLHVQLSQAKEQVGALTSRWEELELKRETTVDPKS
jgi:ATP-binding cassette subfamily F protein uup